MKALLSDHWEKLLAGVALLLCIVSAVFNVALSGPPPLVQEVDAAVQGIRVSMGKPSAVSLPKRKDSEETAACLERYPMPFDIKSGLVDYGGGAGFNTYPLTVNQDKTVSLKEAANLIVFREGKDVAEVQWADPNDKRPQSRIKITARKAGKATVDFKNNAKPVETIEITVAEKDRRELWPPLLTGAVPNPREPGEVTLTWKDHPKTTPGVTLGYVIERRSAGEDFKPILGDGKMLKIGQTSYVDTVQPSHQYEYRILAVGSSSVTDLMSEESHP